jgi:hypothetical protein
MKPIHTLVVLLLVLSAASVGFAGGLLVDNTAGLLGADGFLPVTGGPTATPASLQTINYDLIEQASSDHPGELC